MFVLSSQRRVSDMDEARAWPCQSIRQPREQLRLSIILGTDSTWCFYFAVQQLFVVDERWKNSQKELPVSLANNIEFLRRLPKLNGIYGFGEFELNLRPGQPSPLVETTGFGSNPGNLRMFSF